MTANATHFAFDSAISFLSRDLATVIELQRGLVPAVSTFVYPQNYAVLNPRSQRVFCYVEASYREAISEICVYI